MKPSIPNLTVICVAGNKYGESIASLFRAKREIEAAAFVFLTNNNLKITGIDCINVGGLKTWSEYNRFIIKNLRDYFTTDYCLLVQWDGLVLDGSLWSEDFLKYDYIGAAWLNGECGNGGFSARSKKLMDIVADDDFIDITEPEDVSLCTLYKKYLQEKYDITYAPKEVCDRFSFELNEPLFKTFGRHAFHWPEFRETIVVKRDGACGDIVMLEPLLYHYYKKGFQVALDTQEQYQALYAQHYFPVVPKNYLNPKLECKEVDLNMSYEIKPHQLVLQSYYDMAGITDGEIRNARLNLWSGNNERIFKKYAVIHIDEPHNMPYRNAYGVEWNEVVDYLKAEGYLVFQIGTKVRKEIATYFNTMDLPFLMFFLKGADLVIALDSGPAQIAVGFGTPSVILFGSVDPEKRYPNLDKIRVVQSECPKLETKNCYHNDVSTVGVECVYDKAQPPCATYSAEQIISRIKELI